MPCARQVLHYGVFLIPHKNQQVKSILLPKYIKGKRDENIISCFNCYIYL